jgi:hypothetical protein
VTLRIAGYLDSIYILKNTMFQKLDLFLSSGMGRDTPTLLGTVAGVSSLLATQQCTCLLIHVSMEADPFSETCTLQFQTMDSLETLVFQNTLSAPDSHWPQGSLQHSIINLYRLHSFQHSNYEHCADSTHFALALDMSRKIILVSQAGPGHSWLLMSSGL